MCTTTAKETMKECVLEFLACNAKWESADGLKRPLRDIYTYHLYNILNCGCLDNEGMYCGLSNSTWREVLDYEIDLRHKAMREARDRRKILEEAVNEAVEKINQLTLELSMEKSKMREAYEMLNEI